jgi:hypothetical protein
MHDEYGREWRFFVNEVTGDILRARLYQTPEDPDAWSFYWDGDAGVAFYDEGYRGLRPRAGMEHEVARAMYAHDAVKGDQAGSATASTGHPLWRQYDALDRVAVRITGNLDARFISVPLDRGMVLYALAWDGDPDNTWRNEIEAVWSGDIWRIEVEQYIPSLGFDGGDWLPTEDFGEEWYGEDVARAAYERNWPLAEFPAERTISSDD